MTATIVGTVRSKVAGKVGTQVSFDSSESLNIQTNAVFCKNKLHWSFFSNCELNTNGTVNTSKNTGNLAKQIISFDGASQPFVQTYKYDALYRLIEADEKTNSSQNWKQTFGYDKYGNRTAFSQIVGSTNLPINSETLPSIDVNTNRFNVSQGYTYDKVGNLVGDTENRTFVFNGDNKQVEVKDTSNNVIGTYFYDGDSKRIKKVNLDEMTVFLCLGERLA